MNEADEPSDSFMKGICRDVRLFRSDILGRDTNAAPQRDKLYLSNSLGTQCRCSEM